MPIPVGKKLSAAAATWSIAALATGGVILRPWQLPEALWAVSGAILLVLTGLLPWQDAWRGVAHGTDVYLFLIGMMLLAEVARAEGLFDWLAASAAQLAAGSAKRLFALVYMVGTCVTIFLSNDATAVVLTPAVAAVARTVEAEQPLPYLLVCAFIANAASFALPISNPANLVMYAGHMPPLWQWLPRFAAPSAMSVLATYAALRVTQRHALMGTIAATVTRPKLSHGGRIAALGIAATAFVLMAASALDVSLGPPTCLAGMLTAACVLACSARPVWQLARHISWDILPLVAGLFVLVAALDHTGLIRAVGNALHVAAVQAPGATGWGAGIVVAALCNVMNNLPAGMLAAGTAHAAQVSPNITAALLVGVDLGPNLSVTGSLATILWLAALRREGLRVGAGTFLKLGCVVMPAALLPSLAVLLAGS